MDKISDPSKNSSRFVKHNPQKQPFLLQKEFTYIYGQRLVLIFCYD